MIAPALWLIATLAAPIAARFVQRVRRQRTPAWEAAIADWARAGYGLLPLYGAWVTGAIVARDAGLRVVDPLRWPVGLTVYGLLLGAVWWNSRRPSAGEALRRWFLGEPGWWPLVEEPRWAFYRAVGAVFLPVAAASQLLGLGFGVGEWLLRHGRPAAATPARDWAVLVRLAASAGLYALTGNLWLVVATMAAARALLLRGRH